MTINPIIGGFGDDNLTGTSGNDIFWMGAAFNTSDKLDGGDGQDTITVDASSRSSPSTS